MQWNNTCQRSQWNVATKLGFVLTLLLVICPSLKFTLKSYHKMMTLLVILWDQEWWKTFARVSTAMNMMSPFLLFLTTFLHHMTSWFFCKKRNFTLLGQSKPTKKTFPRKWKKNKNWREVSTRLSPRIKLRQLCGRIIDLWHCLAQLTTPMK